MEIKTTTGKEWREYCQKQPKQKYHTIETSDEEEVFIVEAYGMGKSIDLLTKVGKKIYASRYGGNLIEEINEDDLDYYKTSLEIYNAIQNIFTPG